MDEPAESELQLPTRTVEDETGSRQPPAGTGSGLRLRAASLAR